MDLCLFWNLSYLQKYLLGIVDFHDDMYHFIYVCLACILNKGCQVSITPPSNSIYIYIDTHKNAP